MDINIYNIDININNVDVNNYNVDNNIDIVNINIQNVDINNQMLKILEDGDNCDLIYLDVSKAFDRVDHSFLFSTLKAFGYGGGVYVMGGTVVQRGFLYGEGGGWVEPDSAC